MEIPEKLSPTPLGQPLLPPKNIMPQKSVRAGVIITVIGVAIVLVAVLVYRLRFSPSTTAQPAATPLAPVATESVPAATSEHFAVKPLTQDFVIDKPTTPVGVKVDLTTGNAPAPVGFKTFAYEAVQGKIITISGACTDKYYALLIFAAADDYRTNPAAAKINKAVLCPANKKFTQTLDLKDFNLVSGNYYLFLADQGSASWYNPR